MGGTGTNKDGRVVRPIAGSPLRSVVAADFRASSFWRRLTLVGVVCWLAYEWGPGNETVTPWIIANIIHHNSGPMVIPVTAAVGFAFTTLQQLASGFTALAGFSLFDRSASAAMTRLRRNIDGAPTAWEDLGRSARCALVFGLGTTAVALIQITLTGEVGVRRHASVIRRSAVLCGVLVAVVAATAATVAYIGRRIEPLAGPTEFVLRLLGNPLLWLGLITIGMSVNALRRRTRATVVLATSGD
jgi:hypothetical protein